MSQHQQPDQPRPDGVRPGQPRPGQIRPGEPKPERTFEDVMWGRVERKRERIRAEIQRNRAGGHKVPTWVLAVILGLLLAGWAYLIVTG